MYVCVLLATTRVVDKDYQAHVNEIGRNDRRRLPKRFYLNFKMQLYFSCILKFTYKRFCNRLRSFLPYFVHMCLYYIILYNRV